MDYNIGIFAKGYRGVIAMPYISQIENILEEQKGSLLSSDLDDSRIPRTYLSMMIDSGRLERVGSGMYVAADMVTDEMYLLQRKYPKLIYSHETALYLHDLSDRTPFEYSVTVPSGYRVTANMKEMTKLYYIKSDLHQLGLVAKSTPMGNSVMTYNIERTICDVIRSRNRIDSQIFSQAIQVLSKAKSLDYNLLIQYSREFRVEKLLNSYLEVLL